MYLRWIHVGLLDRLLTCSRWLSRLLSKLRPSVRLGARRPRVKPSHDKALGAERRGLRNRRGASAGDRLDADVKWKAVKHYHVVGPALLHCVRRLPWLQGWLFWD